MNDLDKQYQNLLADILISGRNKKDRTGTGTRSVFGRQIRHDMRDGFPLLTTKKMAWKTMVTELLWFLRGDTNIKYLVDNDCHIWDGDAYKNYCNQIPEYSKQFTMSKEEYIEKIKTDDEFAKKWGELGPIYGKQWRSWKTEDEYLDGVSYFKYSNIDQISWEQYLKSGLNIEINGIPLELKHMGTPFYPKSLPQRAISLMWNQRSVDTFLGLPFNIASYALLLEIIAKEVNMIPDELIGNLGDVHLYSNHVEQAKEQMNREPFELPKLVINDEFWNSNQSFLNQIEHIMSDDFQIVDYKSHPAIKAPLSN